MRDDEESMAQQAAAGDEAALATLLEVAGLTLSHEIDGRIGRRYRGQFETDDILQVTFLEACLRIRGFVWRGPGSFAAWLRRIAENNLCDAIREVEREKRPPPGRRLQSGAPEESYADLIERLAATTTTPSRVCARSELRQEVDRALRQLPRDYEQVLQLYELDGLSGEEVAQRLGRSHGAVRMLVARARERLTEVLVAESRVFSRA